MRRVSVHTESWPIRGVFRISRGARTAAEVVVVEVIDGDHTGRGECVPYPHYGETVAGVVAQVQGIADPVAVGLTREELLEALLPGAARNAVDCALWDLEAKQLGRRVWQLAEVPEPGPLTTAYTISLDEPHKMAEAARVQAHRPLLKIKLTGADDLARLAAVREAAPDPRIIADANEAWTPEVFREVAPQLAALGVEMVEQPFPASADGVLSELEHPVPICADESCHTSRDVVAVADRYELVNVKLDKTGGLTEALRVVAAAQEAGVAVMVGCMIGTSLGVAPATLLGWAARYVDLDAPLLLAQDRPGGLEFEGSVLRPPGPDFWG